MIQLAHIPPHPGATVPLAGDAEIALDHWQARPGEIVTVVDPDQAFFRARLLPNRKDVVVFESLPAAIEPKQPRRLCPVIPDRERMVFILQKAVELGATDIHPLVSERSSIRDGTGRGQDKSGTWAKVVRKAARQCRRARIPTLHPSQPLELYFGNQREEQRAFLETIEPRIPLFTWYQCHANQPIAILSGPEGGWNDRERQFMLDQKATAVSLGYRILRTETAALAALATLAAQDSAFT